MNFNLLISDAYKLIIGDGNNLTINGDGTSSKAKRWNGSSWITFNALSYFNGATMVSTTNVKFYNGSTWENLF